jgi:hypothetical protein
VSAFIVGARTKDVLVGATFVAKSANWTIPDREVLAVAVTKLFNILP